MCLDIAHYICIKITDYIMNIYFGLNAVIVILSHMNICTALQSNALKCICFYSSNIYHVVHYRCNLIAMLFQSMQHNIKMIHEHLGGSLFELTV